MRRQTLVVFLAAAMSVALVVGVSGAVAKNGNGGNGQTNPHRLASQECHAQKKALGNKAFKGLYGKHAMRTCKREQLGDVEDEIRNASQECKAEAADPNFAAEHGGATFAEFYGANDNDKNAHGKCVSGKVRAEQAEELEQLENAAQECRGERNDPNFAAGHGGESFAEFYGTNHNNKNAFGKCVSKKAHEAHGGDDTTS
jgi:hypothetical protein